MAAAKTIVDAGPLVAFVDRRDTHHKWARETLSELIAPFMTCEAVVSEVAYILRAAPAARDAIMGMIEEGSLSIEPLFPRETRPIRAILHRYRDREIDLADACLVRMSELVENCQVATIDRADFSVYRRHRRKVIPLVCP